MFYKEHQMDLYEKIFMSRYSGRLKQKKYLNKQKYYDNKFLVDILKWTKGNGF